MARYPLPLPLSRPLPLFPLLLHSLIPFSIIDSIYQYIYCLDPIDYDQLENETEKNHDVWRAYGRSKLANILFSYELHRRLHQKDEKLSSYKQLNHTIADIFPRVTVNSEHPGNTTTIYYSYYYTLQCPC